MTNRLQIWWTRGKEKMFPSLDSWTIVELEARQASMSALGWWALVISTLVGLAVTLWWQGYQARITERITLLKSEDQAKNDAVLKADIATAQALIPETTGFLIPADGATPEIGVPSDKVPSAIKVLEDEAKAHRAAYLEKLSPDEQKRIETWESTRDEMIKQSTVDSKARQRRLIEQVLADESFLFVFLGNSVIWTNRYPADVLSGSEGTFLSINLTDKGISISACFFNENGNAICKIQDNRFITNPDEYWYLDFSSPHKLVVYDRKDRPFLDVEYVNKRTIRILGEFYRRDGFRIQISPDSQTLGEMLHLNGSILGNVNAKLSQTGQAGMVITGLAVTIPEIAGKSVARPARRDALVPPAPTGGFSEKNAERKGCAHLAFQAPVLLNLTKGEKVSCIAQAKNIGDQDARITHAWIMFTAAPATYSLDDVVKGTDSDPTPVNIPPMPPNEVSPLSIEWFDPDPKMVDAVLDGRVIARVFAAMWYSGPDEKPKVIVLFGRYDPQTRSVIPDPDARGIPVHPKASKSP